MRKPDQRFLGSTSAMVFGILALLAGVQPKFDALGIGDQMGASATTTGISGLVIILGTLAYRSAKKRNLGLAASSALRRTGEITAMIATLALILLQKDLAEKMYHEPVQFTILAWVVAAYLGIGFRKPKVERVKATFVE